MWVGEEPRCIMVFVKIVNGKSQLDEVQHNFYMKVQWNASNDW